MDTNNIGAIARKPTRDCFTSPIWAFRSSAFDIWLPAYQSEAGPCVITTSDPSPNWVLAEVGTTILNIGACTNMALLYEPLIRRGRTMTLTQAEEMAEKTERGEKTGLHVNGDGNFFFVETGDFHNPILVGDIYRDWFGWCAIADIRVSDLRGNSSVRFLVRNPV